ncbi:hypothetical protein HDV01_001769 [Terramyces sp. JEL0728]|nr:hypothetical protein HDV01_001769 [Terramyces sp. JEL0728]
MFGKSNTGRLSNNTSIPVPIKPKKSFTKPKPAEPAEPAKPAKPAEKKEIKQHAVLVDKTNQEERNPPLTPFKKVSFIDAPKLHISDTPKVLFSNLAQGIALGNTITNT